MRNSSTAVMALATLLALPPLIAAPASAACLRPTVVSASKQLGPGATDFTSSFTLTRGKASILVEVLNVPLRCRASRGIAFQVEGGSGNITTCRSPNSKLGPARSGLRCNVDVDGGVYSVRVTNPTACTVRYQNVCRTQ